METVIRVTLIYIFLLAGLRVLGKREFGQLTPLELVTLLLIPELVSPTLVREDASLVNALIATSTLFSLVFLTSLLAQRSKRWEQMMFGVPTVLVQHGRYVVENMNKERVTPDEVFAEVHRAGLERLSQVKWAVLESDGKISIVPADSAERTKRGQPDSDHFPS